MQLVQSNIWDYANNLNFICITTNSILNKEGELVMGKGNAKQAKNFAPNLPKDFGDQIKAMGLNGKFYGLLVSQDKKFIAFQTKLHWLDNSPIDVVEKSCDKLSRLAKKYPDQTFGLPFPGIQNGRLRPKDVYPFLAKLPDNVYVYHLDKLDLGV